MPTRSAPVLIVPASPRNRLSMYVARAAGVGALMLLAACASAPHRTPAVHATAPVATGIPEQPPERQAEDVLFHAIGLVGTPYRWGGNTPDSGFDCSGLVDYVFRTSAGLKLPRTSREMSRMSAPKIKRTNRLATGDLLFFRTSMHRISHVAIYVGKGRFVHAPNSGGTVRLDNLDNPYWSRHFAFARRVLD
ncbi:C40 family peptidase [Oleiagrimonas sp. MCCC 1A03011]|uniref:C40 family peptidase n=1 Tax=Oleiagrimonas sp. MCCC 1A03011 TaxID=1926883 RepID=UPI001F0CBA6A|nr:C40 family peptidase [Oleiagrimonas sp. MCCC 1A03011]